MIRIERDIRATGLNRSQQRDHHFDRTLGTHPDQNIGTHSKFAQPSHQLVCPCIQFPVGKALPFIHESSGIWSLLDLLLNELVQTQFPWILVLCRVPINNDLLSFRRCQKAKLGCSRLRRTDNRFQQRGEMPEPSFDRAALEQIGAVFDTHHQSVADLHRKPRHVEDGSAGVDRYAIQAHTCEVRWLQRGVL